jgi:hypothetical protein
MKVDPAKKMARILFSSVDDAKQAKRSSGGFQKNIKASLGVSKPIAAPGEASKQPPAAVVASAGTLAVTARVPASAAPAFSFASQKHNIAAAAAAAAPTSGAGLVLESPFAGQSQQPTQLANPFAAQRMRQPPATATAAAEAAAPPPSHRTMLSSSSGFALSARAEPFAPPATAALAQRAAAATAHSGAPPSAANLASGGTWDRPAPPPHTSVEQVRLQAGGTTSTVGECADMCPATEVQMVDGQLNQKWASQPGKVGYDLRTIFEGSTDSRSGLRQESCRGELLLPVSLKTAT